MKFLCFVTLLLFPCQAVRAQQRIFDLHVHLYDGETSIRTYEDQLKAANMTVAGFGAMWFGGPNQAPPGEIAQTRAHNDAQLALAARHPGLMPIATVHPYDGRDASIELERV